MPAKISDCPELAAGKTTEKNGKKTVRKIRYKMAFHPTLLRGVLDPTT
jgi:hypothetical protein